MGGASFLSDEATIDDFTDRVLYVAEKSIPKTSTVPRRPSKPWFNESCHEAILERRRALDIFGKRPTTANNISFKIARAKARRTTRRAKRESWEQYVSKLSALSFSLHQCNYYPLE